GLVCLVARSPMGGASWSLKSRESETAASQPQCLTRQILGLLFAYPRQMPAEVVALCIVEAPGDDCPACAVGDGFLPNVVGEVSASYADGEVMGPQCCCSRPLRRFAPPPHFAGEQRRFDRDAGAAPKSGACSKHRSRSGS